MSGEIPKSGSQDPRTEGTAKPADTALQRLIDAGVLSKDWTKPHPDDPVKQKPSSKYDPRPVSEIIASRTRIPRKPGSAFQPSLEPHTFLPSETPPPAQGKATQKTEGPPHQRTQQQPTNSHELQMPQLPVDDILSTQESTATISDATTTNPVDQLNKGAKARNSGMFQPIAPEIEAAVVTAIRAKEPLVRIAERLGISGTTVGIIKRRYKLPMRTMTDEKRTAIVADLQTRARNPKLTIAEIAKRNNIGETAVKRILRKLEGGEPKSEEIRRRVQAMRDALSGRLEAGLSINQIAKLHHVGRETVRRAINDLQREKLPTDPNP